MFSGFSRFVTLKKQVVIALLASVAVGAMFFNIGSVATNVLVAVGTCVATNALLLALVRQPIRSFDSAIISGLLIGLILPPGAPLHVLAIASTVAMLSKFLIRLRGRHLFNPAAFGAFGAALLFPSVASAWWADRLPWFMAILGLTVLIRFRRLPLTASFLVIHASFLLAFTLVNALDLGSFPTRFFATLSPLFVTIMLPEPMTTPAKPWHRMAYGGLVAALAFTLGLLNAPAPLLFGLLAANLTVPFFRQSPKSSLPQPRSLPTTP